MSNDDIKKDKISDNELGEVSGGLSEIQDQENKPMPLYGINPKPTVMPKYGVPAPDKNNDGEKNDKDDCNSNS